jgi:ribosomal protein L1
MEITVFPRAFNIQPGKAATLEGGEMDVMSVIVQDVSGNVLKVTFGLPDWQGFQEFVADPAAAAARAQARAKILGPQGLAPTLRERKH